MYNVFRLISTYYCIMFYTILLVLIMIICTLDPDTEHLDFLGMLPNLSRLPLVNHLSLVYVYTSVTAGAGVLSLVMDLVHHHQHWGAIFHQHHTAHSTNEGQVHRMDKKK